MKKKLDLVSIIITYYKKRDYFYSSLKSALKQTYKDIEIIVVYDDNDRDYLVEIKKLIKSINKVKILINSKNIGAGASRNKAAKRVFSVRNSKKFSKLAKSIYIKHGSRKLVFNKKKENKNKTVVGQQLKLF